MRDDIIDPLNTSRSYPKSAALFERACEIIPGGIHLSGRPLVDPETSPMYFEHAAGCHIRDVDGHEYVDFFMGFGPFLLGYAHPEVEAAAQFQARNGALMSMNHPLHLRFIEALLARFPGHDMGIFFRTGSEATTAALRLARRATGRRIVARSGYHGWHDWCLPLEDFVPGGLAEQVPEFRASDPESLRTVLETRPGEFAAVIVAPEMVLPHRPETFHTLRDLAHAHGAVFIMDEVKTALRIAPNSISERVGITPDLMTVSKALGNGWPVAAVIGNRKVMSGGAGMHYSATFHGDTAAMAAALRTMTLVDENDVQSHVDRLGRRLIDGLNEIAHRHQVPAVAFGEPLPAMPFLRFEHPEAAINARAIRAFYRTVIAAGFLLHPRHMWFISLAHQPSDIDALVQAAKVGMAAARKEIESGRASIG